MQCVNMMIVLVVLMLALLWEVATVDLSDCTEVQSNGVYVLTVRTDRIRVYCDNDTAGGGWTVIQRRINGSVDFYRGWEDYENGFGDVTGEFWLGLLNIHRLTSSKNYTLRVDLEDFDGKNAYTEYSNFRISGPDHKYRLYIGGSRGNAGDSMAKDLVLRNMSFTTRDSDNDKRKFGNCAKDRRGAWWYRNCAFSNLNGRYMNGGGINFRSIYWRSWKSYLPLKHVEMKIRPRR